jgi:hypothetical protein
VITITFSCLLQPVASLLGNRRMNTPKICPVCRQDSIQPINRTVLVKSQKDEVPAVIAYRCGNHHVFLASSDKQTGQQRKEN